MAIVKISEKLKKSFTVDNGKEFAAHKELAAGTGMKVFFCDPYSPWQRGTNENTNGLLRQFFPKGTSFADISDEELQTVGDLINNRSRKRLGFRSPAELFLNFL
ncbi:MAG: IS30 family transposase [Eubacterium sp.]|nr:IS30 family transposase [Eubacterium sp.]